jgi:hypothetical protein
MKAWPVPVVTALFLASFVSGGYNGKGLGGVGPWGVTVFLAQRETLLGRRLGALPCGRPRKTTAPEDTAQERDKGASLVFTTISGRSTLPVPVYTSELSWAYLSWAKCSARALLGNDLARRWPASTQPPNL